MVGMAWRLRVKRCNPINKKIAHYNNREMPRNLPVITRRRSCLAVRRRGRRSRSARTTWFRVIPPPMIWIAAMYSLIRARFQGKLDRLLIWLRMVAISRRSRKVKAIVSPPNPFRNHPNNNNKINNTKNHLSPALPPSSPRLPPFPNQPRPSTTSSSKTALQTNNNFK